MRQQTKAEAEERATMRRYRRGCTTGDKHTHNALGGRVHSFGSMKQSRDLFAMYDTLYARNVAEGEENIWVVWLRNRRGLTPPP